MIIRTSRIVPESALTAVPPTALTTTATKPRGFGPFQLKENEMTCEELFITFLVLFFFFGLGAAIVESLPRRKKPMATRRVSK